MLLIIHVCITLSLLSLALSPSVSLSLSLCLPLPLPLSPSPSPSVSLATTSLTLRGTVEDTELVEGLVLDQKASHLAGGVSRVEKAKIGLIQFCISPPKTDVRTNAANQPMVV